MLYYINSQEIFETLPLEKLIESIFFMYPDIAKTYTSKIVGKLGEEDRNDLREGVCLLNESIKNGEVDENEERIIVNDFRKTLNWFIGGTQNIELIKKYKYEEMLEKQKNIELFF